MTRTFPCPDCIDGRTDTWTGEPNHRGQTETCRTCGGLELVPFDDPESAMSAGVITAEDAAAWILDGNGNDWVEAKAILAAYGMELEREMEVAG